ncbi:hypothetical protein N7466_008889 [Penicillium verhagenii]|uniref:uncharacterized protein n=1 Tax=Penicillium verhagenii TaxID=1562060 RepID=UPI002545066E|nr:uncharacterized protein N7466_008889 [Penicillium verhagenii]KAJ5924702.1 hypothetical protein N7466_008889 [Penicillium verhagenii]
MSNQPHGLGHTMLDQFLLADDWKNFNHGAYGTFPRKVRDEVRRIQDTLEVRPDRFIGFQYADLLDTSREAMANYLNVPTNEIVYVKSATVAINVVLRNISFAPRDMIIYFSTIFPPCEKIIQSVMESTPLQARKIDLVLPMSHEDIVAMFLQTVQQATEEGFNVRIAIFDTIASKPGIRLPFEKLTEVCRERGILSCVDGAHGVGHIPLDLGELNPDFFVSITHKWLYNARGCSVFHVPRRNQHLIRNAMPTYHMFIPQNQEHKPSSPTAPPLVESKSVFENMFEVTAMTDNTSYLTVPTALEFRSQVPGGEDAIFEYNRRIAFEGGNLVAKILGTDILGEPESESGKGGPCRIRNCALANVRLPFTVADSVAEETPKMPATWPVLSTSQANKIAELLYERFAMDHSAAVTFFVYDSALWTRLSGQIYLELDDFQWLGEILKKLCSSPELILGGSKAL